MSTYEEQIAALVDKHITHRRHFSPILPLAAALGCRTVEVRLGQCDCDPPQPPAEYEDLVTTTLITLLTSLSPNEAGGISEMSVLDGLCRKRRWSKCLDTPQNAYSLAATILRHSELDHEVAGIDLLLSMRLDVTAVRREWLNVEDGRPSMEQVARAMFGDAWWDVAVDLSDLAGNPTKVLALIQSSQPTFLPGLLPGQPELAALGLPPMEIA